MDLDGDSVARHGARPLLHQARGEHFARIPCLNDTPDGMAVIEAVVKRELMGWV